jgi:predicted AlkP superfamily phosphohydrolase/phosphomutase
MSGSVRRVVGALVLLMAIVLCSGRAGATGDAAAGAIPEGQHPEKVFLLGLDGATWRILLPMIDAGMLPNIQRLLENGVYGVLFSQAAYSPISWNSIFTGVSKARHGIRGLYVESDLGCSFERKLAPIERRFHVASVDRRATPLWQMVSKAGKRIGVIGYLTTYPADPVNGIFISGDTTPNLLTKRSFSFRFNEETAAEAGRKAWRGEIFGSAATITENGAGGYRLRFDEDPDRVWADLPGSAESWFEVRLDGAPEEFFKTMTDIEPAVRPAKWERLRTKGPAPLEVAIFSGISPRHHYKRRNRPLFLLVDARGGLRYDRVRFAYHQDGERLLERVEIYGVPVSAELRRAGSGPGDRGEIRLLPAFERGIPLRIRWEAGEGEGRRPVILSFEGDGGDESDPWTTFIRWVAANRRIMLDSPTAFTGLVRGRFTVSPDNGNARLRIQTVYDSFRRPTYQFLDPPDLLADLDPRRLPAGANLEIYRNQMLKKLLFDQVFDPEAFDCFMLCFTQTDLVQHYHWNSPDPLDYDLDFRNKVMLERWKITDKYVGEILDRLGPEWAVVVASDHGFHKVFNRRQIDFNWNRLLLELGLLAVTTPEREADTAQGFQPARQSSWHLETLFRCSKETKVNLGGSLALVNEQGEQVFAQRWFPGNGAYPTSKWHAGTVVRVSSDLAFDNSVPPGRYRLVLRPMPAAPGSARAITLGVIEIPEGPRSLIPAEGLFRIGDVEVLRDGAAEKAARAAERDPQQLSRAISLIDWKLTPQTTRYMGYLESCSNRLDAERSTAAYFEIYRETGTRVPREGIFLVGKRTAGEAELLEELAALARSARILELDKPLFRGVRVDRARRCVNLRLDRTLFGKEERINGLAFQTYDPEWTLVYQYQGQEYRRPFRNYVLNRAVGFHENEGVFAISGDRIPNRGPIAQALEWDITPTVLRLLGITPPEGLDGEAIDYTAPRQEDAQAEEDVLSNEELYEQLKGIGYLDNL